VNRDQARLNDILEYAGLIRRHTAAGRVVLDDEVTGAAITPLNAPSGYSARPTTTSGCSKSSWPGGPRRR